MVYSFVGGEQEALPPDPRSKGHPCPREVLLSRGGTDSTDYCLQPKGKPKTTQEHTASKKKLVRPKIPRVTSSIKKKQTNWDSLLSVHAEMIAQPVSSCLESSIRPRKYKENVFFND
jgi:hypothetical protein